MKLSGIRVRDGKDAFRRDGEQFLLKYLDCGVGHDDVHGRHFANRQL